VGTAELLGGSGVDDLQGRLVAPLDGCLDGIGGVDAIKGVVELTANGLEDLAVACHVDFLRALPADLVGDQPGEVPEFDHAALSVAALRRRGVSVSSVVVNRHEGVDLAERTNPEVLERMTDCSVYTLPPLELDRPSDAIAGVRDHLPSTAVPVPP
jgi:dethiobiotin synthetase